MPGGHANHKGSADKPNVNANGQINLSAADKSSNPEDILQEGVLTTETIRTDEFVDYPPALEHPNRKPQKDEE